jgi:ATP-dependent DNA ligase
MTLPVERPLVPMLARAEAELPRGRGWIYEPKWDGFRGLLYRDGDRVHLMSRNGKTLTDYFPEIVANAKEALPNRAVVDGELVVCDAAGGLDFEGLLSRFRPKQDLQGAHATFIPFDLLSIGDHDLRPRPFAHRRRLLERSVRNQASMTPTPQTEELDAAVVWLNRFRSWGIEGVVAKRSDLPYIAGQRVMVKVRAQHCLDCVVGGFIPDSKGLPAVLLLGLYAEDGVFDHVGQTTVLPGHRRLEARERLRHCVGQPGFVDGARPGYSRWTEQRNPEWVSVGPEIVCEVASSAVDNGRLRHSATFQRWRDDRTAGECSSRQLQ